MTAQHKMIPGIAFDFGSQTLVIPPLALGDLELMQDRLAMLHAGVADAVSAGTIIDATHAALKRNYPDITRQDVGALIDLGNMNDVILCVMDTSGIRRKAAEDAEAQAGKAPAVT